MKYLKENFGNYRQHKIDSIEEIEEKKVAHVVIYREGIDGNYDIEVDSMDNDLAIEHLATTDEFKNFVIIEE